MPKNSKRVNYAEVFIHESGGKTHQRTSRMNYTVDTEDSYVKFYYEGLDYIRDMPRDCFMLFCKLMEYCTYAAPNASDGTNDSFVIHLTTARKKKIAQEMGYTSVKPVSNLLTELCYGEALVRMETSCYRPNPYVCGRGAWVDVISVREQGEFTSIIPGSTFMSVYKKRVKVERASKAQKKRNEEARAMYLAGYTVDPETGEAIPLDNRSADVLPHEGISLLPVTEGDTDCAE